MTKCRRNCRARSEGDLLRFESAVDESYERAAAGERSVDVPSILCVTVTMLNASILVRLSCNYFDKIAKGVCEPLSTFDLRTMNASRSSSWRRVMETRIISTGLHKTNQTQVTAPCLVRRVLQQTIYCFTLSGNSKLDTGCMRRRKERREFLQRTSDLLPGTCIRDPLYQPA